MSALILPSTLARQPLSSAVLIDRGNPFGRRLLAAIVPDGTVLRDAVGGMASTAGSYVQFLRGYGYVVRQDATTWSLPANDPLLATNQNLSFLSAGYYFPSSGETDNLFGYIDGNNNGYDLMLDAWDASHRAFKWHSALWGGAVSATVAVDGSYQKFGATWSLSGSTATVNLYQNGKSVGSGTATADNAAAGPSPIFTTRSVSTTQSLRSLQCLMLMFRGVLSASDMAAISANPWQVFLPVRRRIYVALAGGTQFTKTLTCSTTTSASLLRSALAIRSTSTSTSAALARAVASTRSASTTETASVVKSNAKTFTASSTLSATVQSIKALLQSLTTSSTLSAVLSRQAQAVRAASSTLSATVVRSASRSLAAATTASATAVRQAQRALAASTSLVATTVRSAGKALAASSTLSATLATLKQAGGMVLTATITTSASLARSISKGLLAGIGQIATLTLPLGSSTISDVIGRMRRRLRR